MRADDGLGTGVARVEFQLDTTSGAWTRLSYDLVSQSWKGTWDTSTGADGGRTLYVRAIDNAGNAAITSAGLFVANPPAAPSGLVITGPAAPSDGGALDLRWSANTESDVVAYAVYRSNAFAGPFARVATVNGTSWQDATVRSNTSYYYRLTALDAGGNESPRSSVVSGIAWDTLAPAITAVAAQPLAADAVELTWQTHELATSEVLYGTSASLGTSRGNGTERATVHAVIVEDLLPSTTYFFRVRSRDAAGNTTTSDLASFTTPVDQPPTVAIESPANGALVGAGAKLVAQAADDFGVERVEYSVGGTTWSAMALNGITGKWEANLSGIPEGRHTLGVRATDEGGQSALATIEVFVDSAAPVLDMIAPEVDAHIVGGQLHPVRVTASDATLSAVEWQIHWVPPDVELETLPEPDPNAWEPLTYDELTQEYRFDWTPPLVVAERIAVVYARAIDGAGRSRVVAREITIVSNSRAFDFIGTGGQHFFGTVAIEPIGPNGGNMIGIEIRIRSGTPRSTYVIDVRQGALSHRVQVISDDRGRGVAVLEADTAMVDDEARLSIVPRGPGF